MATDTAQRPASAKPQHSTFDIESLASINEWGCYEFDRILKFGDLLKRNKRTDKWHKVRLVVRPNILYVYRDERENKLRHKIFLSDAKVLPRADRKGAHEGRFSVFTPARNYHFQATSELERNSWIQCLRYENELSGDQDDLIIDDPEETKVLLKEKLRRGWIIPKAPPIEEEEVESSSSEDEAAPGTSQLKRTRADSSKPPRTAPGVYNSTSGNELSSLSDLGQAEGGIFGSVRTDSHLRSKRAVVPTATVFASPIPKIIMTKAADPAPVESDGKGPGPVGSEERVVKQGWLYCQKLVSGVRKWKKYWVVLRHNKLALYKDEEEYSAALIIPISSIEDVTPIDPTSKRRIFCMQVITEDRTYRFSITDDCEDEKDWIHWLQSIKKVLTMTKQPTAA